MLIIWIIIFIVSLFALLRGADWLIASAEKIGLAAGLSPFIIGVTIVSIGTSFPELFSAFVAVFKGVPEVVAANAIGSNIANILLVVGVAAVIGRRLIVTKNLIDVDLPLIAITTVLFLGVAWDGEITLGESILMVVTYAIYLLYTIFHKDDEGKPKIADIIASRREERKEPTSAKKEELPRPKLVLADFVLLALGIFCLVLGAKYLIDSLINISDILKIGTGVIAITAVALGTSLPELFVSAKAAFQKKSEVALGNIFGSNVFNLFVVVGLPGLFSRLSLDSQTFSIGLPAMALATFLFVIDGISRRIYIWEGALYLSIYVLFLAKIFSWF